MSHTDLLINIGQFQVLLYSSVHANTVWSLLKFIGISVVTATLAQSHVQ